MALITDDYPSLAAMVQTQLAVFPHHRSYLERRFANEAAAHLEFDDFIAEKVLCIAGKDIERICDDYRWLCGEMLNEELNFRRTGRYRLSTFEEAFKHVYSKDDYMRRYMNGLLVAHVWWQNHAAGLGFFRDVFLPGNPPGFSHLEVGPGHGLFLQLAASSPNCHVATGWDISDASLDGTRAALDALGTGSKVHLEKTNIFAAPTGRFQSIAISEVLEHLENPLEALRILHGLLAQGGRIFIKSPVNSPMPDHIFLFSTPEEIIRLVEEAGFQVVETLFTPGTGVTLERARKFKLGISTAVIALKG